MKNTSASRLMLYLLSKLEHEPVASRAALCDDLAEFFPSESLARQLREQAHTLRDIEQRTHALKMAMRPGN